MIVEQRGRFWPSENLGSERSASPDHPLPGNLKIDADGSINLELDGLLFGVPIFIEPRDKAVINIQGILTEDGDHVFLWDCRDSGSRFTTYGASSNRCRAQVCLVGRKPINAPRGSELTFSRIAVLRASRIGFV